jgi:hypothetical protein
MLPLLLRGSIERRPFPGKQTSHLLKRTPACPPRAGEGRRAAAGEGGQRTPAVSYAEAPSKCVSSSCSQLPSTFPPHPLQYYIHLADGEPLVMAGLWDVWASADGPVHTYTILTTGQACLARAVASPPPACVHQLKCDWQTLKLPLLVCCLHPAKVCHQTFRWRDKTTGGGSFAERPCRPPPLPTNK